MKIRDGLYFIHPDGGAWMAASYRGGILRSVMEESERESHAEARDSRGEWVPSDDDVPVAGAAARRIIAEVMGDDILPERVVVARAK